MTEDQKFDECWEECTYRFDLYGDEWQDKGLDEIFKAGFEAARRSMPAIELPEFFDDPDGCQLFSGSVTSAITAAGYKYKIKL